MVDGKDLFSHFREHSVAEFFKKNKQMLGFSGKVRSLTTIVHEAVSNSLDACEEAGIVPEIKVEVKELGEYHYSVKIEDNGSGIPKSHLGKALGQMLAGTKFHRYVQQRGQQGIGIAAVSMYALLTTAQHPHAISYYKDKKISCEISMDFKTNKAELLNLIEEDNKEGKHGLTYEAEFKDVEYKKSDQGIFEYLRRTALPNPLGVGAHDLLDLARAQKENRKISAFLQNALARLSANKVSELREIVKDVDFDKNPADLTWEEAEKIVQGFKQVKWIAPETDSIVPIGKEQIEKSFMNIFNPEVLAVTERSPKVYQGGVPFAIEAAIAFGGGIATAGKKGEIMRFANRVPLLFDAGGCALTEATKSVDCGRYNLKQFEEEPIVVLINFVSVYVPYTGAGKQAVAQEEDIMDEIKNAVMEAAREVQKYISGKKKAHEIETKRKVISRYIEQLASDVTDLAAAKNKNEIKKKLEKIIEEKYSQGGEGEEEKEDIPEHEEERVKEDDESEEE